MGEVRQFDITPEYWPQRVSRWNLAGWFAGMFCLLLFTALIPTGANPHYPAQSVYHFFIFPALGAAWMTFFVNWWRKKLEKARIILTVAENYVETQSRIGHSAYRRVVTPKDVRGLEEGWQGAGQYKRRGLKVRKYGKLASLLRGYVFVPSELPEYEAIKVRLLGWAGTSEHAPGR